MSAPHPQADLAEFAEEQKEIWKQQLLDKLELRKYTGILDKLRIEHNKMIDEAIKEIKDIINEKINTYSRGS